MWLAIYNACLLGGILVGYALGAYTTRFFLSGTQAWISLYSLDAMLMLILAVWGTAFSFEQVQVIKLDSQTEQGNAQLLTEEAVQDTQHDKSACVGFIKLLKNPIYMMNLLYAAFVGALSAWTLYFVIDVTEAVGFDVIMAHTAVLGVMLLAPIPGLLIGAAILSMLGGYQDHRAAFSVIVVAGFFSLASTVLLSISALHGWSGLYIPAFYFCTFFAAVPISASNGIAVSVSGQGNSVRGSAYQFAVQNVAKAIIPSMGGAIIGMIGLLPGFFAVLLGCAFSAFIFALIGLFLVLHRHQE